MALTRKMLREMGITDEQAGEIIKAHWETVEALKGYKAENEKLAGVASELDKTKSTLSDYQSKYETLEREYSEFQEKISKEKSMQAKRQAVTEMLRKLHISESCVKPILQVTDFEKIKIDENGKLLDEETVRAEVGELFSGFIPKRYTYGAETAAPPVNSSDRGYSREDIRRMSSREINENYQAIRQSLETTID